MVPIDLEGSGVWGLGGNEGGNEGGCTFISKVGWFNGVGLRSKGSKRSALRCIARRLCFFEKRGRCSVESVEWGGYRFWGVW